MSTIPLIYKYPNIKKIVDDGPIYPIYINPHLDFIDSARFINVERAPDALKRCISRHSSNTAIKIMTEHPGLINFSDLIFNKNPKIGPLLEMSMDDIDPFNWEKLLIESHNPVIMAFLEKNKLLILNNKSANYFLCRYTSKEGIQFLKNNPHKINWEILSNNPYAIDFLKENQDKIYWSSLSSVSSAIDFLKENQDKINWICFSENTHPDAIRMIEQNLDKICFERLSVNPNAVHILMDYYKHNPDKINFKLLSQNPNPKAMEILMNHYEQIDWYYFLQNPAAIPYLKEFIINHTPIAIYNSYHYMVDLGPTNFLGVNIFNYFVKNPKCIELIEDMLESGVFTEKMMKINRSIQCLTNIFRNYESIYALDYQAMSKIRSKIIRNELEQIVFHPYRVKKWLDYFCDNGGDNTEFDWVE
jgi:hypothetical protein